MRILSRPRWLALALVAGLLTGCELVAGQVLAEFRLDLEPAELEVDAGGSGALTVGIEPVVGVTFSRITVTLADVDPDEDGIGAETLVVFGAGDYPWEVEVEGGVPAGEYELTVEAVSQGTNLVPVEKRATLTLVVGP